jgi:hypothetical protein
MIWQVLKICPSLCPFYIIYKFFFIVPFLISQFLVLTGPVPTTFVKIWEVTLVVIFTATAQICWISTELTGLFL